MAARSDRVLDNALIRPKLVTAGQAVSAGRLLKRGTNEGEVVHAGANENGYCVANHDVAADATDRTVMVTYLTGPVVIPVKVGTGGATEGQFAINAANGLTNSGTLGGGTVVKQVAGWFTQTGVAGDVVGLAPAKHASVAAS